MGACTECQQKCVIIHGKSNPASSITSFFKVMIDDELLETLYLPPRFARAMPHLAGREIYLEDNIGIKSKATVSKYNGSLAIRQGWRQFSLNHAVVKGDFLVFYFITGPEEHFVIHVYGRSGCLKTKTNAPPDRKSNKRARTVNSSPVRDSEMGGVNLVTRESPSISFEATPGPGNNHDQPLAIVGAPIIEEGRKGKKSCLRSADLEEPLYLSDRDAGCTQERKKALHDLSQFEMPEMWTAQGNGGVLKGKSVPFNNIVQWEEDPSPLSPATRGPDHSPRSFKMARNECGIKSRFATVIAPEPAEKMKLQEKEPMQMGAQGEIRSRTETPASTLSERKCVLTGDSEAIERAKGNGNSVKDKAFPESTNMPLKVKTDPCNNGARMTRRQRGGAFGAGISFSVLDAETNAIKKEPMEMETEGTWKKPNVANNDRKTVKSEPVDASDFSAPAAEASKESSCSALIDGRDFLDLPDRLPGKERQEKEIIYLTDPSKRVWPAFFHRKKDFTVLAEGWKEFSAANRLKPEDVCIFRGGKKCDYSVDIRRKEDDEGAVV